MIAFEVIRSKLLLLMRLIANPSCLDSGDQCADPSTQVAKFR